MNTIEFILAEDLGIAILCQRFYLEMQGGSQNREQKKKNPRGVAESPIRSAPGKRLALHKCNLIRRIFQSRTLCIPENLLIHARSRRRSTDSTMEKYRRVEKPKGMTTIHKIICGSSSLSLFVIMILYLLLFLFCIFFFFLS